MTTTSPFGFLLPPHPPLIPPALSPQTLSPSQLTYTLPASSIGSHISIFLLPGQSLPAGSAAALYIQFPRQPDFRFLGALGDGKSSAVFRVAGLKPPSAASSSSAPAGGEVDMDDEEQPDASAEGDVIVGVSLEAVEVVAEKVAASKGERGALVRVGGGRREGMGGGGGGKEGPGTKVLAQRIIKNAFNFLASFEGGTGMVPIKAFEGWWQKFERRIEADPGFLEREQD